jgi:hypothetical protein
MTTIVSLSTIPTRFSGLDRVLKNILAQTAPIDEVRLYIPRKFRRFPDYDGALPDVPAGVRIIRPNDDLGPASKILFAADELKGEDCDIIFCDDDMLFEPDRFERIIAGRDGRLDHCVTSEAGFIVKKRKRMPASRHPNAARRPKDFHYRRQRLGQFWREWRTGETEEKPYHPSITDPGYVNIAQGFGGVLVRPEFFDAAFYDIPTVLWAVDDYWLSGHFERKGVPIWGAAHFKRPAYTESRDVSALYLSVLDGANREEANNACIKYMQETYGIWQF